MPTFCQNNQKYLLKFQLAHLHASLFNVISLLFSQEKAPLSPKGIFWRYDVFQKLKENNLSEHLKGLAILEP